MKNKFFILVFTLFLFSSSAIAYASGSSAEETSTNSDALGTKPTKNSYKNDESEKITYQYNPIKPAMNPDNLFNKIFNGWEKEAFWAAISAIIAYALVVLVELLKEPQLYFDETIDKADIVPGSTSGRKWKFVHIRVRNFNRKFPQLIWITPATQSAFSTKATIAIKDGLDEKEFVGRWDSLPQPIQLNGQNYVPDFNLALIHPREDIHPQSKSDESNKEAKNIVIGLKYENEDEFYGFNNESYIYMAQDYKNNKYKFGKGEFKGKVVLSTLGLKREIGFTIYNNSSNLDDFYIEVDKKS